MVEPLQNDSNSVDSSTALALTLDNTHIKSFPVGLQHSNCIVWHDAVKSDLNIESNNTHANWSNNLFLWSKEHGDPTT